jgi:hypothetical protein
MPEVKNRCKKCGYSEKYNDKEHIVNIFFRLGTACLLILGVCFIFYIFYIGLTPVMLSISNRHYTYVSISESDKVREESIKIIKDCEPLDKVCYSIALYNEFSNITYIPDPLAYSKHYPPAYVHKWGDDCEGLSQMYVSYAQSIGLDSFIECNKTHCWAMVYLSEQDFNFKVDLTTPQIIREVKK